MSWQAASSRQEFESALQRGLGRVILQARSTDVSRFRDLILEACLHVQAPDPEMEGTRASYMFELVSLLPAPEPFHRAVLEALPGSGDTWGAVHRFRFAHLLASEGAESARQALRHAYSPGRKFGALIGCNFVDLDGVSGLIFAAEKMGEFAAEGPRSLLDYSRDELGESAVDEALAEAAAGSAAIRTFLDAARSRPIPHAPRSPRTKRPEAGEQLANDFGTAAHTTLLGRLKALGDSAEMHGFALELRGYWRMHPDAATEPELLRHLYQQGRCAFCRWVAVSRMLDLGIMPDEWREECRFDSFGDTRALAKIGS